jgi:uncharacterized YccA/Bax inhibitor family protein
MARRPGFGHSNPIFERNPAFTRGYAGAGVGTATAEQLRDLYDRPSATPAQMGRMTIDDVIVKCAISFGTLIAVAAASFFALPATLSAGVILPALLVGLVLGLVMAFKQSTNPAVILGYAVAEGFVLGGISRIYASAFGGSIVPQAVLGTFGAVAGMLVLYSSGTLRATPKFTRVLMTAAIGYLAVAVVSMVTSFFGVGHGWGFYGVGPLGVLLCVAGVAVASLFLIMDFDFIERGIRAGAPARYSWLAAGGLMMTLIWLYLEVLRLLAILRD